jgi:hypothetical protein
MQQLTYSAPQPNDPKQRFIEQMHSIIPNSEGQPALHQVDLCVLKIVFDYINNPTDRIKEHRLLVVMQNNIVLKMPIDDWQRKHPDFNAILNDTYKWLLSTNKKSNIPNLLELELNPDAKSLCVAIGKAVYNYNVSFKLKALDRNHARDPRPKKRIKKLQDQLKSTPEQDKDKITKIELKITNTNNITKAKKIDFSDRDLEGNNHIFEIPCPDSVKTSSDGFEDFIEYLNEGADEKLAGICGSARTARCNCHTIWIQKSQYPEKTDEKIAEELGVSTRTLTGLWHNRCNPYINRLKQEFDNKQ